MKRILVGLVIGLALLEAGRRLHRPADEASAAGCAAYGAGDFAAAEARFRQAEQGAANPAVAAHNHAAALYQLGRFEDAERAYERSADEPLRAARAAYDRGNCAFRQACAEEDTADPDLLERASRHYQACLATEGATGDAGPLFDDARHNLELARLILAEFAEPSKDPSREERAEASGAAPAESDPFAPSNDAHPPQAQDSQPPAAAPQDPKGQDPKQADDANGPDEDKGQKPSASSIKQGSPARERADAPAGQKPDAGEPPPGAGPKEDRTKAVKPRDQVPEAPPPGKAIRECKECNRYGCPKCKKKPGKGPGTLVSPYNVQGPKPNPGKQDNGKAPGPGKSQNPSDRAGVKKKGKTGDGGKTNPNGPNGVGTPKEAGVGPADPNATRHESKGKAIGPDGITFEKQDKSSTGGTGSGPGDGAEKTKEPHPGGKDSAPNGAPGEGGKPRDTENRPPQNQVDKLFKPGTPRPSDRDTPGTGGSLPGPGRNGFSKSGRDEADETDGQGDPVEQAAARRLRQAIQRIQNSREGRQPAPGAGKGEPPPSGRRRDW
jgi:hypothetical protein